MKPKNSRPADVRRGARPRTRTRVLSWGTLAKCGGHGCPSRWKANNRQLQFPRVFLVPGSVQTFPLHLLICCSHQATERQYPHSGMGAGRVFQKGDMCFLRASANTEHCIGSGWVSPSLAAHHQALLPLRAPASPPRLARRFPDQALVRCGGPGSALPLEWGIEATFRPCGCSGKASCRHPTPGVDSSGVSGGQLSFL